MMKTLVLLILVSMTALAQMEATTKQFLLRIERVRRDLTRENMTEEERRAGGEHFTYLKSLQAEGKLAFAGQAFDPKGFWGAIVVNAPDAETATALLNGDSGVKAKLFRGEVIPFRIVLDRCAAPAK